MKPSPSPRPRSRALSAASCAVQDEARDLLAAAAGSDQAKRAVESATGQPVDTAQREAFARGLSFGSYLELFEASKPLSTDDDKHWLATNIGGNQWIVWNEQNLEVACRVESLDEAQELLAAGSAAAQQSEEVPPTG